MVNTTATPMEKNVDEPLKPSTPVVGYGSCWLDNNGSTTTTANGKTGPLSGKLVASAKDLELNKSGGDGGGGAGGDSQEPPTRLERLAERIPCLGILLAFCSSIALSSAAMLVKLTTSVHGIQVAVFRAMIQLVVYSIVIKCRALPSLLPEEGERFPVIGRALLGSTSITLSYYALKLIPLGDATTIRFSLPIWVLIIGYFVLGESCSFYKIGAVVVSIAGVILIAKPDDVLYIINEVAAGAFNVTLGPAFQPEDTNLVEELNVDGVSRFQGCMLALTSSVLLAMSMVALRLCRKTPAEITVLWLSIFSVTTGTITLLGIGQWRLPDNWLDVLYILLNGLLGSVGQWCITAASKVEQSGVVSLARTLDIQIAFMYSAFILHEQIRNTSICGSVLVSLGVVSVILPKWLGSRTSSAASR